MRKLLSLIIVLVLLSCIGCSQTELEKNPKSVLLDDTGYVINITYIPKRIVSLSPSNTEILFAIGAGDRVVGVTDYCNYPPKVLKMKETGRLKSVGGYSTVNIERVVGLDPDLVVASYGNGLETIETMRNLGLTVVAFNPKNLSDIKREILILGKITGNSKNASKLVEMIDKRISKIEKKVSGKKKLKVCHIIWHDPIWVTGKQTFINEIIEISGGVNAFNFNGWRIVSIEDIIAANPDVILVNSGTGMVGGKNLIYDWVMNETRLKVVNAIKFGRVYVIDADLISRPSYRLVLAAEEIAKFLHPEAFSS